MRPASGQSRLFERGHELDQLTELVDRARSGRPGLVVIEGPGGIGKTRLLTEARRQAEARSIQIRSARGHDREERLPFGIVDQLFAGDPAIRGALAQQAHGTDVDGDADVSFATLAHLHEATERLAASGPLMLVVDDAHLSDAPSLQFLSYLARRLDGTAVSIVLAIRPFERSEHAALLAGLATDPQAIAVRPAPLSDAATSELLADGLGRLPELRFSATCREATGGNPLLLGELVKTLRFMDVEPVAEGIAKVAELGPRALLRTVLVRLSDLGDDAGLLARSLAVLGDDADLSSAAQLAGLDGARCREAASRLIGAEVLADGAAVRFVHPLVGAAVYETLPAPERAVAHERAAALLRALGRPSAAVAAHLMLAPPSAQAWVSELLVETARASLRAGAPVDAVAAFTRALAEPPPQDARAAITFALGRAAVHVDGPAAEAHLREALRLAEGPSPRGHVALDLARLLMFLGRVGESLPLLRDAAAQLGSADADLTRMLFTAELMASLYDPAFVPAPEHLSAGRRLPLEPGVGSKMLAAMTATILSHDGAAASDVAELALAALDGGDLARADGVFLSVSAVLTLDLADRREADDGWSALLRGAHDHGSLPARFATNLFRGYGLARRGMLEQADRSLDDAVDALADWKVDPRGQWHAAAFRSFLRREQGDLVAARLALMSTPRPVDASDASRVWNDSEIRLLLAEGRAEEALHAADATGRRFAHLVSPLDTPTSLLRARALTALGRSDEAVAAAEEALTLARGWGAPGTVARALRVLGTAQGEAGIETLREAVATADGTPARLELAKAQFALGTALFATGDEASARPVLRAALELAALLGTRGLVADARRALLAAGGRPRSTALSGPASLTPSERRVADQAAAGASNREIAEALVVTQKTVELHLSNAYRKLGVSGRGGLAAALEAPPAETQPLSST